MFNKILVPLDGSDLAGKVLPKAEDLANCFGSQLVLLTVGSEAVGEIDESSPEVKTEAVARLPAVKYLQATTAALRAKNLAATWVFKQGDPAPEMINYAGAHRMDLILLGSHGAGEVAWLLGSVARRVVSHSPVPVLLIRVLVPKPPEHKDELAYFSM
ncbi:MAG: universal stress protein [Desulfobaccales bacterium]